MNPGQCGELTSSGRHESRGAHRKGSRCSGRRRIVAGLDMLSFLANNVEQLDLALDHIEQGDANNARFGLMLTDNVVEITLHRLALDRQQHIKENRLTYEKTPFPH